MSLAWILAPFAGMLTGLLYFRLLGRAVERWVAGDGAAVQLVLLVVRLGLAAIAFGLLVQAGALALLLALAGFLLARHLLLRPAETA